MPAVIDRRKSHDRFRDMCFALTLRELRQRQQREGILVQVVRQGRRPWGSRSRWPAPRPGAVGALRVAADARCLAHALAGGVAAASRPSTAQAVCDGVLSPPAKRCCVVAGTALAPAAVGVLDRAQPLAGAEDVRLAIVVPGGTQAAQRQERAVDVVDAPAAVPAAVRLLVRHEIVDAAPDRRVIALEPVAPPALRDAAGDVRAGRIEHRVVIGERHCVQKLPVVVDVERRPAAVAVTAWRAASSPRARRRLVMQLSVSRCACARAPAAPSPCRRYPGRTRWRIRSTSRRAPYLGRFTDQSPLRRTSFVEQPVGARGASRSAEPGRTSPSA